MLTVQQKSLPPIKMDVSSQYSIKRFGAKPAQRLMIGGSAVTFVIVLSPYIAANVSKISMSQLLLSGWLLAWSVAVALSTILIIASVCYAQKRPITRTPDAQRGASVRDEQA